MTFRLIGGVNYVKSIAKNSPDKEYGFSKVDMSTEPVSIFSLWDESITGKNLEFEKDKKIVQ
ncbi:MAG TPA: hypothetical protein VIJ57_13590 [Hanamia sp.]